MSIEHRRFVRFLLDIPAVKFKSDGQKSETQIRQVSVGGCLIDWDETIFPGDEFRLEMELPNKNRLPLQCKVIYKFDERGVGARFYDITQFEQELLADVISDRLENEGLPLLVDPFTLPPRFAERKEREAQEKRVREEKAIEEAIAGEN